MQEFETAIFDKVLTSSFFEEYCKAFVTATGLTLELTRSDKVRFALCSRHNGNNLFCQLMSEKGVDCETCRLLNVEVWEQIREATELEDYAGCSVPSTLKSPHTINKILAKKWTGPRTFVCFAGMCETMVPVKTKEGLIGFLKTGQVLLQEPTREAFQKAFERIGRLRDVCDPEAIELAYFKTPVVPPAQYDAMVTLLKSFADQISRHVEQLSFEIDHEDPRIVQRAKDYIHENFDDPITLESLAKAISISPAHLSRVFKQATGVGYLEYLNRYRIEQSMKLLTQKNRRISEIAYEVGFQSLAPFNRMFRDYAGTTPKDFRRLRNA